MQIKSVKWRRQLGFSLIELMVGLTIGLIVTLAVFQTMGLFETQRRSTTGTADVQTNGNIAIYSIARDLKQAGFALMPQGSAGSTDYAINCKTLKSNSSGVTSLNPVDVTDGTAVAGTSNASDSITIRFGSGDLGGAISGLNDNASSASTPRSVDSNLGCSKNDVAIINSGGSCDLTLVTDVSVVKTLTDPITVTLKDAVGSADSDFACLGKWSEVTYSISSGSLVRTENGTSTPVISDAVDMQVQYGISNVKDSNQINQWVEPSGAQWGVGKISAEDRKRIKAIRVAVITRNPQIDNTVVSYKCSSVSAASPTGVCAWEGVPKAGAITTASDAPVVDLSVANPTDWDKYHYRVFETVIPLRNTIWAKDSL